MQVKVASCDFHECTPTLTFYKAVHLTRHAKSGGNDRPSRLKLSRSGGCGAEENCCGTCCEASKRSC